MRPPDTRNNQDQKGPQILTDRIKATEVRLLSEDEAFGIVSRAEAEKMSKETGLDLIIMSLDSSPPVVKLMDYGKYKYEKERKDREARKKQHVIEIKEVKMTVRIDKHDLEVKVNNAIRFLNEGDKVKCTIRLKGREVQHTNLALELAKKFAEMVSDAGTPESFPKVEGRNITLVVAPGKKKPASAD